jgi:hypothetical protein
MKSVLIPSDQPIYPLKPTASIKNATLQKLGLTANSLQPERKPSQKHSRIKTDYCLPQHAISTASISNDIKEK